VPPKNHTNSSSMAHFPCTSVGPILDTLPPSGSRLLSSYYPPSAFSSQHPMPCPPFVRTNASFVLVSQLTRPLSNNPFIRTNASLMRTNASFILASHLIDPEMLKRCRFCNRPPSSTESITAKNPHNKKCTGRDPGSQIGPSASSSTASPNPPALPASVKLNLMFSENGTGSLFSNPTPAADWATAYCDGGSRGNPGPAGYGVFIEGPNGEKLAELSEYLGKTTNNVAEYSALLGALDWALQQGRPRLRVVADSELLVKQIQGRYKVNSPDLRPLFEEAKRRIARLDQSCAARIRRPTASRTWPWTKAWAAPPNRPARAPYQPPQRVRVSPSPSRASSKAEWFT
jgi:ribonuclease HI